MSNSSMKENFENKSELIRNVYQKYPLASNAEIKKLVKDIYDIEVQSNLIIFSIGKFSVRRTLAPAFQNLKKEAKLFLAKYQDNLEQAIWYLRQAAL